MKKIAATALSLALFLFLFCPSVLDIGKITNKPEMMKKMAEKKDNPSLPEKTQQYVIKKGDTLSQIAKDKGKTVEELLQANGNITDPDKIYAGSSILIPAKAMTAIKSRPAKKLPKLEITVFTHIIDGKEYKQIIEPFGKRFRGWVNVGTNPNLDGDLEKNVNDFDLEPELKVLAIKALIEQTPLTFFVRSGMYFNQMTFWRGLWQDVVTAFQKDAVYEARLYMVRYKKRIYCFVVPLVCRNISWFVLNEPEELQKLEEPPKLEEPRKPEEPEKLMERPVKEEPGPELLTPPPPPPPPVRKLTGELPVANLAYEYKTQVSCNNQIKVDAYAGRYWGAQRNNRHDVSDYIGGNMSYFPCELETEDGENIYRVGPSGQWIGFRGEVDRAVEYKGQMPLYGAEFQRERPTGLDTLMTYYGRKTGEVEGIGFDYKAKEHNDMIAVEHNSVFLRDSIILPRYELGGRYEFDLGGEKNSTMNGKAIPEDQDERRKQGVFLVRGAVDIYDFAYATPKVDVAGSYRQMDHTLAIEPRLAAKLFGDRVEPGVSYNWREGSQNDMVGAHVIVRPPVREAFDIVADKLSAIFSSKPAPETQTAVDQK